MILKPPISIFIKLRKRVIAKLKFRKDKFSIKKNVFAQQIIHVLRVVQIVEVYAKINISMMVSIKQSIGTKNT